MTILVRKADRRVYDRKVLKLAKKAKTLRQDAYILILVFKFANEGV